MTKTIYIDGKKLEKFSDIQIETLFRPFLNLLEEQDEEFGRSTPVKRMIGYKVTIDGSVYYSQDMKNYNNEILEIKTSKELAFWD